MTDITQLPESPEASPTLDNGDVRNKINEVVDKVNELNSTSDYIDIGNHRIQWGRFTSASDDAEVFSFPVPFLDGSTPNITITAETDNQASAMAVESGTLSSTGFSVNRIDSLDNTDSPFILWQAIGLKP